MQSWPGSGQNGANDGHNSWPSGFAQFTDQNNQFDPSQGWSQPGAEQPFSHLDPQDPSTSNFFEASHQGNANAYLGGGLHATASSQAPFHAGHGALSLNQQFSQPGQDVLDPAFSNIHPELYGHQPKVNLGGDGIGQMGQVQSHQHGHPQGFNQHEFPFTSQNDQLYDAPGPYSQPQQVSQPSRQGSNTPVQHFENLHGGFPQGARFAQSPQPPPVQHQQQPPYRQGQPFSDQYQLNNGLGYQPPSSSQYSTQQTYAPSKPNTFTPPQQGTPVQQQPLAPQPRQQQPGIQSSAHSTMGVSPNAQYGAAQQPINSSTVATSTAPPAMPSGFSQPVESGPKKRKRATKSTPEPAVPEQPAYPIDFPVDILPRRSEDPEILSVPLPSAEEAQLIAQFAKRNKAAQNKYPSIKGLPFLVYDGTIKLPAPKSYDKLSPCIALPPHSDRSLVPELGYLPCEIQGKFSTQYRPSADRSGLDERREEARQLLAEYDRSMYSLGKRRPKYTEYPHAFKEQLKSDEASKNKAEKRAKKEQEDDRAKPIRPLVRPADPTEAVAWDIVGIVNIEPSVARTSALIAGRVQQAGEFFIKLRGDMNKAKLDVDNATKNKVPEPQLAELKKVAEQKKEALYRALDVTIEHADDGVLDNLGGHQKLVLSLVNAMISSIKAGDFSGKLPKALLEIFTHFRMTKKIAETTNFETVRKRFEDKGDDEVKEMAREIAANMKKALKSAESETVTGYTGTSAASRAKAGIKMSADATSAKRARDDDSDSRTVKKIAVEPGSSSLSKKLAQPKIQQPAVSKIIAPKGLSSILPGKARPVSKPVVKSDADSPSASSDDKIKADVKKVVTKVEASRSTVPKVEAKPPVAKASSTSSSSALSGIASLLDSINAPKPVEPPVPTAKETRESDTPEAPEEKAKRLRKEARRKLRVSWKPETELVQVRIFHKDDEEDEGRGSNLTRDAADDRSEGMVLKQRVDVEDDDDDDDIPYQPWLGPIGIDFSALADDVRAKNYVTRGGTVTFTTDEQHRIAEREQRELMAIYTDIDDIPPTPKSPLPEAATAVSTEAKTGYLPREDAKFEEIQLRWRDEQQYGLDEALRSAMKRLDARHSPSSKLDSILGRLQGSTSTSASSSQPMASLHIQHSLPLLLGDAAEKQLLAVLLSDKTKAWRDPNPVLYGDSVRVYNYTDPTVRLNGNAVEEVVKSLISKAYPPTSPPDWLSFDQERIREWWFGYNKEVAARQKREDEAKAKAEAEANALKVAAATAAAAAAAANPANTQSQDWSGQYAQQQGYAPYMALLQQMTGGHHPSAAAPPSAQHPQIPDGQLQSILAAINQPQQAAPAQAANIASYLNPNDPSYQQLMMLTQMAQGQQPPPPPPPPPSSFDHRPERDWDRNDGQRGSEPHGKEGRKKKGTLPPHKPANKALIGTKPCTFWQQGKCARGDKCTFRHG